MSHEPVQKSLNLSHELVLSLTQHEKDFVVVVYHCSAEGFKWYSNVIECDDSSTVVTELFI